jgi:hypothetical protein
MGLARPEVLLEGALFGCFSCPHVHLSRAPVLMWVAFLLPLSCAMPHFWALHGAERGGISMLRWVPSLLGQTMLWGHLVA